MIINVLERGIIMANPIVTITMENGDVMKAELYPEIAPNTVKNFVSLVSKGYYDGLIFHRVIQGFMIQGGCPEGTGMGGPGYSIKGEFSGNGFTNDLKHTKGVLSMARSMMPNSAGSQFFIMHETSPHLDGQYAAFGKVTEGLDVVDKIAHWTKCDESWFCLVDKEENGVKYSCVYDLEKNYNVSLQYGLKLLGESFDERFDLADGYFTDEDKRVWENIKKKLY